MNGPVQVFTAILLISAPTAMFEGFSRLRLRIARRLNGFQVAYFRAGNTHAGALLVLSLAVLDILTSLSRAGQWIVEALLLAGSPGAVRRHAHPHGHRQARQWLATDTLTSIGAVFLAGVLLATGVAVTS